VAAAGHSSEVRHTFCPQDEAGKRLEATHGELVLDIEHGTIFSVSQYHSQPGLGYFCLEAEKATLYHRGVRAGGWVPLHI
jgi:autophagy-related protein 2